MARLAGKARGDMRAMEEEAERHNPINPKAEMRTGVYGRGATPSMGLSQFRGGRHMEGCGEDDEESESDEEMRGGMAPRMVGAGTGGRKKGMSEATQMGLHLGRHLHKLHGAGFWDDFKSGFNSVVAPVASVAKSVLPMLGPEGMAASAGIGALGYGRKKRGCGTGAGKLMITHGGASNSDTGAYEGHGRERDDMAMLGMGYGQDGHGMRQGGGFLSDLGIPVVSNLAGMVGLGTGAGTGGRKKRAPAGANDGRRKRAEVVRKVMADKGLSMIDASKYVKAHNLY